MDERISHRRIPLFHQWFWILIPFTTLLIAISIGTIPLAEVWKGLIERIWQGSIAWNALIDERLPRALTLLLGGASMAVAGAVMQALFQSPLATPTLLGNSAGSSIMMLILILMQWPLAITASLPIAAIVGSLISLIFVHMLWRRCPIQSNAQLLLIGLAFSMLLLSIESTLLYVFRGEWQLMQLVQELLNGSQAYLSWQQFNLIWPPCIAGLYGCLYYRKEIDILCLGEEEALSLGVNLKVVRWRLFLCVSLLSGGCIAVIGSVPFFGMLLPCLLRLIYGPVNAYLLPVCIACGGTTLLTLDTIIRVNNFQSLTPQHLSGLAGSGVFLWLILSGTRDSKFSFS